MFNKTETRLIIATYNPPIHLQMQDACYTFTRALSVSLRPFIKRNLSVKCNDGGYSHVVATKELRTKVENKINEMDQINVKIIHEFLALEEQTESFLIKCDSTYGIHMYDSRQIKPIATLPTVLEDDFYKYQNYRAALEYGEL